jgi:hypothetical protein
MPFIFKHLQLPLQVRANHSQHYLLLLSSSALPCLHFSLWDQTKLNESTTLHNTIAYPPRPLGFTLCRRNFLLFRFG